MVETTQVNVKKVPAAWSAKPGKPKTNKPQGENGPHVGTPTEGKTQARPQGKGKGENSQQTYAHPNRTGKGGKGTAGASSQGKGSGGGKKGGSNAGNTASVPSLAPVPAVGKGVGKAARPVKTGADPTQPYGVVTESTYAKASLHVKDRDAFGQVKYPDKRLAPWRVKFSLPCAMNDANSEEGLEKDFPGCYVATHPTKGINAHTVLHHCRVFMEQDVFQALSTDGVKNVLDAGGNARRAGSLAKKLGMAYHSANPTIETADLGRAMYWQGTNVTGRCSHKAQDCTCMPNAEQAISIHSLYYFTPQEWATVLFNTKSRMGHAVVHHFSDDPKSTLPPGAKKPEAHIERDGSRIMMSVDGNSHRYSHDALDWLRKETASLVRFDGRDWVLTWNLRREVRGTAWYSFFLSEDSLLPMSLPYFVATKVEISEKVLQMLQIESYSMTAGFMNLVPVQGTPRKIYMPLLQRLLILNAGKFPSASNYTQLLSSARKLSQDDVVTPKDIRAEPWFSGSLVHTATLAYLQTATDLNNAQRSLEDYMPMLEGMGYMMPVARSQFGDSLFGRVLFQVRRFCLWVGLEVPYEYVESVSSVYTPVMGVAQRPISTALNMATFAGGCAFTLGLCGVELGGLFLGFVSPRALAVVSSVTSAGARRLYNTVPYIGYACDPDLVQVECDARRVQYIRECAETEAQLALVDPAQTETAQLIKHLGCHKQLSEIHIRPNRMKEAPVPYCVTEYAGLSNAPYSGSDSNKMSALLHRLLSGVEYSSPKQIAWEKQVLSFLRQNDVLPSVEFIEEWNRTHPRKTPREWLETEYGRRDDKNMYAKLLRAVEQLEGDPTPPKPWVEWFSKSENAPAKWDNNKVRGIFDPNPLFKVATAPDTHRACKLLWNWFSEEGAKASGRTNNICVASGTTAPILGGWMKETVDEMGTDIFILEIDVSAFEANQTVEQNSESFGEMGRLGASMATVALYESSNDLLFVDRPRDANLSLPVTQSTVVAKRRGGNPSGMSDVTFRNTFNTLVSLHGLLMTLGFCDDFILKALRALLLGDDNFTCLPNRYRKMVSVEKVTAYYKEMHNWDVKVKLWDFDDLSRAEFCSCYFAENATGGYNFTPKIGRVLSKTFYLNTSVPHKPSTLLGVVRGLGHYETGYLFSRVMAMLEERLLQRGHKCMGTTLFRDWSNNPILHTDSVRVSDLSTRAADELRYDLSPRQLEEVLSYVQRCIDESDFPRSPIFFPSHPLFDHICYVDMPIDYSDLDGGRVDEGLPSRHLVRTLAEFSYYTVERGVRAKARALRDRASKILFPERWGAVRLLRGPIS